MPQTQYIKNLLNFDNNGFNKYHANLVYNGGDITTLKELLNSDELLKENPQEISKIFLQKSTHRDIKLNILEMALFLSKINNEEYTNVILTSKSFAILDKDTKILLLTEGGQGSALIQSMLKGGNSFNIIMNSLSDAEKEAVFNNEVFIQEYIQVALNKQEFFQLAWDKLTPATAQKVIMQQYQYGANLLEHLVRLQGSHLKLIEAVVKTINNFSEQDIKNILAPHGRDSLLKTLVMLNGDHTQELTIILNSDAFKNLDKNTKILLLTEGGQGSLIKTLVMLNGDHTQELTIILNSDAFKNLDKDTKILLLTEGGQGSALIQSMLKGGNSFNIIMNSLSDAEKEAVFNNEVFIQEYIQVALNKQEFFQLAWDKLTPATAQKVIMQQYQYGENLLEHLVRLQGSHSKLIEAIVKTINNFSELDIKSILAPHARDSLFKTLVMLNGDHTQELTIILNSDAFKNLDKDTKILLLTEGGQGSLISQIFLKNTNDYTKILLEIDDPIINQVLIGNIKNIPQKELLKFKNQLIQSTKLKNAVDEKGFSAIYHLKQRALTENEIQTLKDLGYKEILPDGFSYQEFDTHVYYTSTNAKKNALIFIGEDHNGANDTPIIHSFLLKGYNIIAIDVRTAKSKISADTVYKVANDYSTNGIELFIIESHGSENSLTDEKHSIPISGSTIEKVTKTTTAVTTTYNSNTIETTKFLKNLSLAVGNKPISVLLSSCKGQLAVEGFEKYLPPGSEILTLGEYQNLLGKHQDYNTIDSNVRNFANSIFERRDLDANNINLKKLGIIYSNQITDGTSNSGFGSPYYSKILENSFTNSYSCISVDPKQIDHELLKSSKNQLLDAACGDNNQSCREKFSKEYNTLLSNPELYSTENLMKYRDNNKIEDYTIKLSLKCWLGSLLDADYKVIMEQDHSDGL